MTALLKVAHAGPHVSFQDGGRPGNLRYGVPRSGPMDRLAHVVANVVLGEPGEATTIEVSAGGIDLECIAGTVTLAVAGGGFAGSWNVLTLRPGRRLVVTGGGSGSWAYIAVAGTLRAASWLGHTATHSPSGFGGGSVSTGDVIEVSGSRVVDDRIGEIPQPEFASPPHRVRVVLGPQDRHFTADALAAFTGTTYTLTAAYDRMGVRLSGAPLPLQAALSIPSEPIVRGSVQVAGDAVPTVLLADHQTTGGYPKIATVISADIDGVAQLRPGDPIEFAVVSAAEAVATARERASAVSDYLATIGRPGRTLAQRLMRENLISTGDVWPTERF